MKIPVLLGTILVLGSVAFAAEDGAAIFKSKCAMCHGPEGQGKIGPALKGTKVSEAQIVDMLTNGAAGKKSPHNKPLSSLTKEQAQAVAAHVKGLK